MGAAGFQFRLQQGVFAITAPERKDGVRGLAALLYRHAALAIGGRILVQRQFDVLARIDPVAVHQCQITLVGHPVAHLFVQIGQRAALFGQ